MVTRKLLVLAAVIFYLSPPVFFRRIESPVSLCVLHGPVLLSVFVADLPGLLSSPLSLPVSRSYFEMSIPDLLTLPVRSLSLPPVPFPSEERELDSFFPAADAASVPRRLKIVLL